MLKPIKVTTISDKSDYQVRFDLFDRLNRGGVILAPQEIRACIYRGPFSEKLRELAKLESFKTVVKLPKRNEKNGTREEYVLRFFAFLYEYKNFEHSVVGFLNNYMERSTKIFNYSLNERLFQDVFQLLADIFPEGIIRYQKITPVNLFEGVAVGAALAYQDRGKLSKRGVKLWINSEELRRYTTAATNSPQMVKGRIEFCRDRFLGK